jgi:hypothetical protein
MQIGNKGQVTPSAGFNAWQMGDEGRLHQVVSANPIAKVMAKAQPCR